jgi:cytochrome c553
MRILISLSLTVALSAIAFAADNPEWAYPPIQRPTSPPDNTTVLTVPGSNKQYTQLQIDDPFSPADWFPDEHPPMPQVVAHGGMKPDGRACALCHLPTGNGHPESANLAGLPADYIRRQMALFKSGQRAGGGAGAMLSIAPVITDSDVDAASDYFAKLKPTAGYGKVVETDSVNKSYVGTGGMRYPAKDGGSEPLGDRIIPLPDDATAALLRNPHSGFTYYVPKGSVAKGEALATTGGDGKTVACRLCHGLELKGSGQVPGISGRTATYLFRQLNDIKQGLRNGIGVTFMRPVVANLDQNDMIALAAYLQSRDP